MSLRVAIVGGGFSGTSVLAHLVRHAALPFHVDLYDARGAFHQGLAYGTKDVAHLLNVRADRMGALADAPEDFFLWLQGGEGKYAASELGIAKELKSEDFLPRTLYGRYLHALLERVKTDAAAKGITLAFHASHVVDAVLQDKETERLTLFVEKRGELETVEIDALVLATGNLAPRPFPFQPGLIRGAEHFVAHLWQPPHKSFFPDRLTEFSADSETVIIGTGLTMVDAVLTLKSRGYKGTITAISRHGWLPAPHAHVQPYPAWEWVEKPERAPDTVLGLYRGLRQEVKSAAEKGYDWRSVIDSIRPVTQKLWKNLGLREKRKLLARLFALWNIHRHRMAPEVAAEMKSLRQSGMLKICAGKIYYIGSDDLGLTVAYRKRGANRIDIIRAGLVLNCTGPEMDIAGSQNRLLKNLRDRELVIVGPLRVGIESTADGNARGRADKAIFPIGSLLTGEHFESTAVPELRAQAKQVAAKVLERLADLEALNDPINLRAMI